MMHFLHSMKHRKKPYLFGMMLLLPLAVATFLLAGCGKKGPPVAPRQVPIPVVVDLQTAVEGDMVTLSWSRLQKGETAALQVAGYFVNRSKTPLAKADCVDCPILFQRIADISTIVVAPDESEKALVNFSEQVEKGHRYIYMVTAYTPAGVTGRESNRVEFIH